MSEVFRVWELTKMGLAAWGTASAAGYFLCAPTPGLGSSRRWLVRGLACALRRSDRPPPLPSQTCDRSGTRRFRSPGRRLSSRRVRCAFVIPGLLEIWTDLGTPSLAGGGVERAQQGTGLQVSRLEGGRLLRVFTRCPCVLSVWHISSRLTCPVALGASRIALGCGHGHCVPGLGVAGSPSTPRLQTRSENHLLAGG